MPPMPFHNFLRWLLPKEDHFYDYLEQQTVIAHKAALALKRLTDGAEVGEVRASVQVLEHEGDDIVRKMLDALGQTFVTPIDREDLQKLSKRIDDISDLCNAAARACVLFGVNRPTPPMCVLIENLVVCTAELELTMPHLRKQQYDKVSNGAKKITELEKASDAVFRDAISKLFHDPAIDAKDILREKEVLDDLEKAVNRCEQVADTLASLAVKHA
jgi:uncharacterized protein Yka (UPF0111/DUF47 family)